MKACGIVAEYNPLHTGHVYQMNKARQISQADCIIVVMSGNFVQRGEPAVIDKYARTSAALKAGADIVVELPVYYALSSAENFAKGAVLTLNTMKAASICFGAETDNADCLAKISRTIISESPEYKAILNKALAEGLSYHHKSSRVHQHERCLCARQRQRSNPHFLSFSCSRSAESVLSGQRTDRRLLPVDDHRG